MNTKIDNLFNIEKVLRIKSNIILTSILFPYIRYPFTSPFSYSTNFITARLLSPTQPIKSFLSETCSAIERGVKECLPKPEE